jgi:hypothetical protein
MRSIESEVGTVFRPPDIPPKRKPPEALAGATEGGVDEAAGWQLQQGFKARSRPGLSVIVVGPDSLVVGPFASLNEARVLLNGGA